jgi:hypothetical protein
MLQGVSAQRCEGVVGVRQALCECDGGVREV